MNTGVAWKAIHITVAAVWSVYTRLLVITQMCLQEMLAFFSDFEASPDGFRVCFLGHEQHTCLALAGIVRKEDLGEPSASPP